jgi:hypothetical protein
MAAGREQMLVARAAKIWSRRGLAAFASLRDLFFSVAQYLRGKSGTIMEPITGSGLSPHGDSVPFWTLGKASPIRPIPG